MQINHHLFYDFIEKQLEWQNAVLEFGMKVKGSIQRRKWNLLLNLEI